MVPYHNNPHLIADLAQEHYRELRREADAWRLARAAQKGTERPCVQADTGLKSALMKLHLWLAGTPRAQIATCP